MHGKKLQRLLACLLAVLLLSQVGAFSTVAAATSGNSIAQQSVDASSLTLQDGTAVIPAGASDADVKKALAQTLVKGFDQMTAEEQESAETDIEWEYQCEGKSGSLKNTAWGSIGGFTSQKTGLFVTTTYTHPRLGENVEGTYQVRIKGQGSAVELNRVYKPVSSISLKDGVSIALPYQDDATVDYAALRKAIFAQVVESTTPELTADDVTIEYYATATTGSMGSLRKKWVPLEGGKFDTLTYPAIGEGSHEIQITFSGDDTYKACAVTTTVTFTGRAEAPFQLKQDVTEVSMVYNKDQSINYEATAQALREALLVSTDPAVSIDDVTVEYKTLGQFKPLDCNETLIPKFGLGEKTIRFTWSGNKDYKAFSEEITVNMTDNRQESAVVLKEGASITYNMDASVMEQAILENLIDWDASTLPEKSTLSVSDFTIEYYGESVVGTEDGSISGGIKKWVSIAGVTGTVLNYPQMGAGEQQVRVTFKGDAAYRPSAAEEGTLTVNKAKVSVKVHTTSIYADEKPGEGFVTTDPADKFDIYTIYGGVTSNVTTSVFIQLPARLTNNTVLNLIDKTLKAMDKPTLTEIMQNGTTVGELKSYLGDILDSDVTSALKPALAAAGIDLDTIREIYNTLDKLPGLMDDVRVAFGTPDQAGLYMVTAVTNNKNYNTGVGAGMLVVKKHYSGVKLVWNQTITNGKISAADAADFDFGATLTYNGDDTIKQDNVHYLYSGFTSKWKPYSSTTTPPTKPGRYVVTVVTLGGNYQAAPITRAFQITK